MNLDKAHGQECGERRVRRLERFWSVETGVFLGVWFWLLIAGESKLFRDPGVFWHIVVGEGILATGHFPYTDRFSFTFAGEPWIARQWLAECALALLHRLSGFDGVLLGTVTLLACFYTWLAHRFLRAGAPWWMAVLLTVLALKASYYHLHPRPNLVTLVLLGWTFARLCDFEAKRIPLRQLFWLVPVSVVWANAHDGVVGGLGTMALSVAGWGVSKLLGQDTPLVRYRELIPLGGLVLGCALTSLLNPYGIEVPRTWFALMSSPVVPQIITEHFPLTRSPVGWTALVFGLLYLAALAGVRPQRPRVTWLIPLVWFCLAWSRIRFGPLFVTTAALALAEMVPHVSWMTRFSRWGSDLLRMHDQRQGAVWKRPGWTPALLPIALVLTSVALQGASVPLPVLGRGWAKLDPGLWPVDLLPELRAYERTRPDATPIFNQMVYGGFLIYYTPGLRVFVDDRCELYGDEHLLADNRVNTDDPAQIERWAEEYGFDRALTLRGSVLDWYLRQASGWGVVRETETATLSERVGARGIVAAEASDRGAR
jgi:hypothetical protein